jgi:hypothetical protein
MTFGCITPSGLPGHSYTKFNSSAIIFLYCYIIMSNLFSSIGSLNKQKLECSNSKQNRQLVMSKQLAQKAEPVMPALLRISEDSKIE